MEYLIAVAGFLGAWALVAGPLRQGAAELRDAEVDREGIGEAMHAVERRQVSPWWWLLPPVAYVKIVRESRRERAVAMAAMTVEQRRQLLGFMNVANGWLFVAVGAFLIALKETWELVELLEWPVWAFWVGILAMAALSFGTTVRRLVTTEKAADPEGFAARRADPRRGRPGPREEMG